MNKDSTEKDLRQELEVLKKSLAEATCALTRVMNERDAAIKERDALEVLKKSLAEATCALTRVMNERDAAIKERDAARVVWLAMRRERDGANDEIKGFVLDAVSTDEEVAKLRAEIVHLNARLAALRAAFDRDRRDVAAGVSHEADADALRNEVASLKAEARDLRSDRSALRREVAAALWRPRCAGSGGETEEDEPSARALPTIRAEDAVLGVEYLLRHGDWSCDIVILGDAGWRFASRMSPRPDIDDDRILTPLPAVEPDAAEGWADDTECDLEEGL